MRAYWLRIKWFLWNLCIDLCLPVPSIRWVYVGRDVEQFKLSNAECDELDGLEK